MLVIFKGEYSMQRIIIGTAGHVDHGKSSLAKALTGVDPDRLPEEKERQMSIDLGFVFMPISPTEEVAIIDVPGHEGLLRTMIAGANSIRVALFVVAADEGVKQQTIEHFDVLKLLKVEKGIIVVTKMDKSDPDYLALVEEEIRNLVAGSFLESAPICRVSTITNEGLAELKENIRIICQNLKSLPDNGMFRCPIDRIFTLKGFGTIVAGTVISGRLKIQEIVEILPIRRISKIRNLQIQKQSVSEVFAGQRVAFNLSDIMVTDLVRGYELSIPDYLVPTRIIDASVSLLPNAMRPLVNNERVRFHKGTAETMARVMILDKDKIEPGGHGYVQFRFEKPIVGERKERFIIRSYSPMKVIGGGQCLEIYAHKGGRYKDKHLKYLSRLEQAAPDEIVDIVLSNVISPIKNERELSRLTNIPVSEVGNQLQNLFQQKKIIKLKDNSIIHYSIFEELKKKILSAVSDYIGDNPLKVFMPIKELMKAINISDHSFCQMILEVLEEERKIESGTEGIKIVGLDIKLSIATQKLIEEIENFMICKGYELVRLIDITNEFSKEGDERLKNVLNFLLNKGRICEIRENAYLHRNVIEQAKTKLVDFLKEKGVVRAKEFKELLGVSRDLARDILDYFLAKGITVRSEGTHRLADND